ncbi:MULTISPECIES: hypothetical protein [Cellvibrio]|jgi:hypothetical protein|nr:MULTISPECIES: hypothetical protein [Cellvibrio]
MFKQSLFNRYPRTILVLTLILLMSVISLGLVVLGKVYVLQ